MTDSLKTYVKRTYDDHLLDVLTQLGLIWILRQAYCLKIYPKICDKIILQHHNFFLKMILCHSLG